MTKVSEKILKTLDVLIHVGKSLSPTVWKRDLGEMTDEKLDMARYVTWNTQCLNLLSQIKTGKSIHYEKFLDEEDKGHKKFVRSGTPAGRYRYHSITVEVFHKLAILRALQEDIKSGNFFDEELLISADAFEGILEQAAHLLSSGYKDAAAVLVGAVLESTLKKLCEKSSITYATDATINPVNDLLKDKIYNTLAHKQIIAWADLRNNAAHGKFDKYDKKDVERMLDWTKSFLESHLE
jgi:hypothetical protein